MVRQLHDGSLLALAGKLPNLVSPPPYAWKDMATALGGAMKWGVYEGENFDYNCAWCGTNPVGFFGTKTDRVIFFFNPLPDFTAVKNLKGSSWNGDQLKILLTNIPLVDRDQPLGGSAGVLNRPGIAVSEHPDRGNDLKHREAYMTMILKQIMAEIKHCGTAAFVFLAPGTTLGGYYGSPVKTKTDSSGNLMYGNRCPAITISPGSGIRQFDQIRPLRLGAGREFTEWICSSTVSASPETADRRRS